MRHLVLIATLTLGAAPAALSQEASTEEETIVKSHGITYFGEPNLPADFKHLPYVNPDAPKGGELSQFGIGGYNSFNPYTFRGRATAPSVMAIENLMIPVADDPLASYCLLCETIEYPESRDWVIFNLRPEAKFSDGTPLTADDVKFTYETLREKAFSSYRTMLEEYVASVEVLDPHRVKFVFTPEAPRRDIISQMGGMSVFSEKDFEDNNYDLEQPTKKPFLGSGPYALERQDFGRSITLKRNPDYWGKDLPINIGRNNFDRLRFEYFDDYDAAFEAFKAGIYTFRAEQSDQHWATRYNFPAVENGQVIKEEIPNGDLADADAWVFNLRREKFQDPRVREAIGLAFNFEWSNSALFYDLNERVTSLWENSDLKASGTPSEAELALLEPLADSLPEGVLTDEPVSPPVSGERQLDRKNMRQAGVLLEEAGWRTGDDGMRRNDKGQTLKVEFLYSNQSVERYTTPFVQNLRTIGVDAVATRIDPSELTTRTRSHEFDIVEATLGGAYVFAGGMEQRYGSDDANDVFNPMGLADPAVDALIAHGQKATTLEETNIVISALDRVMRALRFWVPQWYKPDYLVAYYDYYEHPKELPPHALGVTDFWWANPEKLDKLKQDGVLQ
ncbi:extracellular solute-binding protein [Paracoccus onubensis]|uniref:extracellular solute-binding protein n=1 Tax=Paracoccus onubensis TaxID=1675788 RepID=UPI002731CC86|nr:extracellular solute-binding protein [Paracoccus onubensis]MDP0929607.1 extracellular solute-binding protein [Paracoccus onubensis]